MSKRNITFTKPEEPSFLKKIKQQVGYKEGPSVDTKRQNLGAAEDLSDGEEEQPTIVVLHEGDLTSEEVSREKERLEKEAAETPADLTCPILFKARSKKTPSGSEEDSKRKSTKQSKKIKSKTLLSFDDEEEDDN